MLAAPTRKNDFAMDQEVAPPVDAAASLGSPQPAERGRRLLPEGLKLPTVRQAFDAAWPPFAGLAAFVALWALLAPQVETSLGALPGPGDVWRAFVGLMAEYSATRAEIAATEAAGAPGRVRRPSSIRFSPRSRPWAWASSSPAWWRYRSASSRACRSASMPRSIRWSRSCARSVRWPGCRS